jgi:copper chaperone CopZ
MYKTILKIDGMKCSMCEEHVNDLIRKNFIIKKVKSSHIKNQVIIFSLNQLDQNKIQQALASQGYILLSLQEEIYQKKFLF